jgi:hypothetical protein
MRSLLLAGGVVWSPGVSLSRLMHTSRQTASPAHPTQPAAAQPALTEPEPSAGGTRRRRAPQETQLQLYMRATELAAKAEVLPWQKLVKPALKGHAARRAAEASRAHREASRLGKLAALTRRHGGVLPIGVAARLAARVEPHSVPAVAGRSELSDTALPTAGTEAGLRGKSAAASSSKASPGTAAGAGKQLADAVGQPARQAAASSAGPSPRRRSPPALASTVDKPPATARIKSRTGPREPQSSAAALPARTRLPLAPTPPPPASPAAPGPADPSAAHLDTLYVEVSDAEGVHPGQTLFAGSTQEWYERHLDEVGWAAWEGPGGPGQHNGRPRPGMRVMGRSARAPIGLLAWPKPRGQLRPACARGAAGGWGTAGWRCSLRARLLPCMCLCVAGRCWPPPRATETCRRPRWRPLRCSCSWSRARGACTCASCVCRSRVAVGRVRVQRGHQMLAAHRALGAPRWRAEQRPGPQGGGAGRLPREPAEERCGRQAAPVAAGTATGARVGAAAYGGGGHGAGPGGLRGGWGSCRTAGERRRRRPRSDPSCVSRVHVPCDARSCCRLWPRTRPPGPPAGPGAAARPPSATWAAWRTSCSVPTGCSRTWRRASELRARSLRGWRRTQRRRSPRRQGPRLRASTCGRRQTGSTS